MTKPTIGRVVWYYPYGRTQVDAGEQPHAGIIAYVHSDTMLNISYFDSNGNAKSQTSVELIQDNEIPPESGFCCWPVRQ